MESRVRAGTGKRACFSVPLSLEVEPAKCKFKVKYERAEVVLTLRKARAGETWPKLTRDVNYDGGDQGDLAPPPDDTAGF